MAEYAPCFRALQGGERINCVASLVTYDDSTVNHLMSSVVSKDLFAFSGTIPYGKLTYTLLQVRVARPMPRPLLVADEESRLLHHDACTWESVREVIELCAGYGGLGQGLLTTGFSPKVCCDMNPLMNDLYKAQMQIPAVCGDISQASTIAALWKHCPRSTTLSSGVSCQPYSQLGDGRSGKDPRAQSLPATLACAHYLRSVVVIIECVEPAQADEFVIGTIRRFCQKTGFHYTEAVLRLQHVWPCARNRWWCILSAPALGPIRIKPWPILHDCTLIKHVLPYIIRWPFNHEKELELLPHEVEAFLVDHEDGCPFFINRNGVLPCPLHAWGSQLRSCPCKCRSGPLSSQRLQQRGLFGVVVKSAVDGIGVSRPRHIHPTECGILVGQDPTIDFGEHPLLTLSAAGQIASPLQSAWVGAHVIGHFEELQRGIRQFEPIDHLQALRTILMAKSQAIWPFPDQLRAHEHVQDIRRWEPFVLDRYETILASEQWDFLMAEKCLAGVLRQLREEPGPGPAMFPSFGHMQVDCDGRMETVSVTSEEPEPELLPVQSEVPRFHVVHVPHDCAAVLYPPDVSVVHVRIGPHTTVQHLLEAESQLHGFEWSSVTAYKNDGTQWALNEVIVPGQLAQICIVPHPSVGLVVPGRSVSFGFPGVPGQGPLPAESVQDPVQSTTDHVLSLRLPGQSPVMSAQLPFPLSGFVSTPEVRVHDAKGGQGGPHAIVSTPCVPAEGECLGDVPRVDADGQTSQCIVPRDAIMPPTDAIDGECGPLPCKLPTLHTAAIDEPRDCLPDATASVIHPGASGDTPEGCHNAPGSAVIHNGEYGPLPFKLPMPEESRSLPDAAQQPVVPGCHTHERTGGSADSPEIMSPRVNLCPLIALDAAALMRLGCSYSTNQEAVDTLLHQVITTHDRCAILRNQGLVWADDEVRWHMTKVIGSMPPQVAANFFPLGIAMIDPLLMNGWVATSGVNCANWIHQHCPQPRVLITVAKVHNHWVPFVMIPQDGTLQVHTWDEQMSDHSCFHCVFACLATSMGLEKYQIERQVRMFAMNEGCGAIAIAFLAYMLMDKILPASPSDVVAMHEVLRHNFDQSIQQRDTCVKPWQWANGRVANVTALLSLLVGSSSVRDAEACPGIEWTQGSVAQLAAQPAYAVIGECEPLPFKLLTETEMLPVQGSLGKDTDMLPAHSFQGECEPLPSKLLTEDSRLLVPCFQRECEPLPSKLLTEICTLPETCLHGECGPLPCKLPTARAADVQVGFDPYPAPCPVGDCFRVVDWEAFSSGHVPAMQNQWHHDDLLKPERAFLAGVGSCLLTEEGTPEPAGPVMPDHAESPDVRLPVMSASDRRALLHAQGSLWADDEIRWHMHFGLTCLHSSREAMAVESEVAIIDPLLFYNWIHMGGRDSTLWVSQHCTKARLMLAVVSIHQHWVPFVMIPEDGILHVHTWDAEAVDHGCAERVFACMVDALGLSQYRISRQHRQFPSDHGCGPMAIAFLAHKLGRIDLPQSAQEVGELHDQYRSQFLEALTQISVCPQPVQWADGLATQAENDLAPVLIQHGVPPEHAVSRAKAAIRSIGAQPVLDALGSRIPWKQLKTLGNQVKFQFLLPAELQAKVDGAAGQGSIGRPKGGKKSRKVPQEEAPPALDPTKFAISHGVFQAESQPLHQRSLKEVGPTAEGVVILTKAEALPYLQRGTRVSNLPLALLILQCTLSDIQTSLPHHAVTVPCHCVVNNEPMLIDMIMVQVGTGVVEKTPRRQAVHIDTVDVGTLRLTVFRDEIDGSWDRVMQGPMKYVVHHLPLLRLCRETDCQCPHWHNKEGVATNDALVDVWRRQYMRNGYKPESPSSATMFGVSIRVPSCLVMPLLRLSSVAGIYIEPRTLDSRAIHEDYAIVWLARHTKAELNHLCQTNPSAIGLARVGDRIGLRTLAVHASALSKAVRPDQVYLSAGPKQQFLAGPFPFGTDRGSLAKALQQISWEARPLQPLASIDNKGAMWLIQATDAPPTSLLTMSHGDVMISRHKGPKDTKEAKAKPVATMATIALCNAQNAPTNGTDPWSTADPWGGYAPSTASQGDASAGLQQLESRIQQAVLASLPASNTQMEVDDMPDRVQVLEQQVQTMIHKHAQLEASFTDHSTRQSAQIASVQTQLQNQGLELRGHIESQQQNLQAMFESQMSQIRTLLKRPRDDHE